AMSLGPGVRWKPICTMAAPHAMPSASPGAARRTARALANSTTTRMALSTPAGSVAPMPSSGHTTRPAKTPAIATSVTSWEGLSGRTTLARYGGGASPASVQRCIRLAGRIHRRIRSADPGQAREPREEPLQELQERLEERLPEVVLVVLRDDRDRLGDGGAVG